MSSAPKCDSCNYEMDELRRMPFVDLPRQHPGTNYVLRRSGHPNVALANTAIRGAAWAANYFLEKVEFQCAICGATKDQIQRK